MTALQTYDKKPELVVGEPRAGVMPYATIPSFTALIGGVSRSINSCELTYRQREKIDYHKACEQLEEYRRVLGQLDVELIGLEADDTYPDCCFVQDTAVVLDEICVMASMGAPSRAGETRTVEKLLSEYRPIKRILGPATLDGGDVVQLGKRLYVGMSKRTNALGILRFEELVAPFGYAVIPVCIDGGLHLTTGCGVVNDETVVLNPRWLDATAFKGLRQLHVSEDEPWAANTIRIKSTVCVELNSARTIELIEPYVGNVETVDISEFRKAEGSLSCLSLIFKNSTDN